MGDSTSAMGWMQKSNFTNDDENDTDKIEKLAAAHHLAQIVQESLSCLYTQWFRGKDNDVSDSLSRDHHLSASVLTNLLSSSIPNQLPPDFNISPLPSVIYSWLCSLLAKMPVNKARQVRPKMITLAAGADGSNSSTASSSRMTCTSSPSPNHGNTQSSYQSLPKPSVKPGSLYQLSLHWLKEQSKPPLTTCLRPYGMASGQIPASMTMENCRSFFRRNTAATATSTRTSNNRKRSCSSSFANSLRPALKIKHCNRSALHRRLIFRDEIL